MPGTYIVGENDVWMLQFKDPEHRDVTRRNAAVAFAVGAAQELGMRGQCAHVCVMDDDGRCGANGRTVGKLWAGAMPRILAMPSAIFDDPAGLLPS